MIKLARAIKMEAEPIAYRSNNMCTTKAKDVLKKSFVVSIFCIFLVVIEFSGGYIARRLEL